MKDEEVRPMKKDEEGEDAILCRLNELVVWYTEVLPEHPRSTP
jgi:hypothetical protein